MPVLLNIKIPDHVKKNSRHPYCTCHCCWFWLSYSKRFKRVPRLSSHLVAHYSGLSHPSSSLHSCSHLQHLNVLWSDWITNLPINDGSINHQQLKLKLSSICCCSDGNNMVCSTWNFSVSKNTVGKRRQKIQVDKKI